MKIHLYNIINFILFPVYFIVLLIRILSNKDNIKSATQRLSIFMPKRPNGDLIWIHAASMGESVMVITLLNALNNIYPNNNYLVTSGTISSAKMLKGSLPNNAIHQFTPIDNFLIVNRFINHWSPILGIFVESELWPCLTKQASKKFDLILINARLSNKSYKLWQKYRTLFQDVIANFQQVLTQSKNDLEKFSNLGCKNIINLGNLKFANQALKFNQTNLEKLQSIFLDKKIFVASSTHKEDEEIIFGVIKKLKQKNTNYYPIVIPRHPKRINEIIKTCNNMGLSFARRSENTPENTTRLLDKDVYIVDSFGELGLFYKLAFISFVGGSFARGGHNLMEPAFFNNVIMFGPDMSNFQNIAEDMIANDSALQIKDKLELQKQIEYFLEEKNNERAKYFANNAHNYLTNQKNILDNYIKEINKYLKVK